MEKINQIFQVVMVVRDREESLAQWRRLTVLNEESLRDGQNAYCKYYRFNLGGVELKLCEPLDKDADDSYARALRERGQGFHHIGLFSEDSAVLREALISAGYGPLFSEAESDGGEVEIFDLADKTGLTIAPWDHIAEPLAAAYGGAGANPAQKDPAACGASPTAAVSGEKTASEEPLSAKLDMDCTCQVAVVVPDLEAGLSAFREIFGIDESSLSFSDSRDAYAEGRLTEVKYRGVEGVYRYRQYNFFMGGMDIEMFAPLPEYADEVNPFTDFLKENGGPGIHHLNIRLRNRDEGIRMLREELGLTPLYDLYHLGRHCAYYDLREQLGLIIEYGMRIVGPRAALSEEEIARLAGRED